MSLFSYIKEYDKDAQCHNLCLIETNETSDNHQYNLVIPEESVNSRDKRIWVAVTMTNWMNTVGKVSTFKEVVRQFERTCKQAEKLKI